MTSKLSTKREKKNFDRSLSRNEEDTNGLLCIISIPQSDWVDEVRIEW